MKNLPLKFLPHFLFFTFLCVIRAQERSSIFQSMHIASLEKNQQSKIIELENDDTVIDLVIVNRNNTQRLHSVNILHFNLYDGLQLDGIETDLVFESEASWHSQGRLEKDNKTNGSYRLFSSNGMISGFFYYKDEIIRMTPLGNSQYAIYKKRATSNLRAHPLAYPSGALYSSRNRNTTNNTNNESSFDGIPTTPLQFDVMVIYTGSAEASINDPIENIIMHSAVDANQIYYNSYIGQYLKLRIVHIQKDDIYIEDPSMGVNLERFSNTTDEYFTYIHELRNQVGADIVILVTEGGGADCGLATTIGAYQSEGFAAVKAKCMDEIKRYTFTHEIGHLFGGMHEIKNEELFVLYEFGSGFWTYSRELRRHFKTVMAIKSTGGHGREKFFSNPLKSFNGIVAGTIENNDVARVHKERINIVSEFRDPPSSSLNVKITGPSKMNCNTTSWHAILSNGEPPFSFQWYYRNACETGSGILCDNHWKPVGNNSSVIDINLCTDNSYLKIDVSDNSGNIRSDEYYIQGAKNNSNESSSFNRIPDDFFLSQNYPNPFNSYSTIMFGLPFQQGKSSDGHLQIKLFNVNGDHIKTLVNQPYAPGTHLVNWDGMDYNGLRASAGIYFYQLIYSLGNHIEYQNVKKLILLK